MRGTFLETDNSFVSPTFTFVGVNFCSEPNLAGVELASDKIRELSFRYANADGTSAPLKVYSPEEGYILKDISLSDIGNVTAVNLRGLKDITSNINLSYGSIPIFVGGDHSVTYSNVCKICETNKDIVVVQFDAHSDYIDEFQDYPHGSVMREISKLDKVAKIIHFGIRGNLNCDPAILATKKKGNLVIPYVDIQASLAMLMNALVDKEVYITFDTDFLNPSVAPATNCLEPGGPSYEDTKKYLNLIVKSCKKVVGIDFVEYNPKCEGAAITGITIVNLIMEVMSYIGAKLNISNEWEEKTW